MKRIYLFVMVALLVGAFIFQAVGVSADFPGSTPYGQSVNLSAGSDNLSLEQLTEQSDAVVLGTISTASSRWDAGHKLIVTDATVSVNNVLKGDKNMRQAQITQVGGKVGDITLYVSSSASLNVNEQSVLFLKNGPGNSFSLTGGKQGQNQVRNGYVDSGKKLDEFAGQVQQYASKNNVSITQNSRTSKSLSGTTQSSATTTTTGTTTYSILTTAPVISNISASSASAGTNTQVTISGSYFGTDVGTVNFYYRSGQPMISGAVVSWSDTSIVTTVPVGIINGYSATASSGPVQIVTSAGTSNSYQFGVTFSYLGVKWSGTPAAVNYMVNPAWVAGAETAVQNAAQSWNNAGATFNYVYAGLTGTTTPGYNGINELMGGNLGSGIIASTYSWWNGANVMMEFDMVFNTYYPWSTTGASGAFDTQTIATHELGHALGLRDLYGNSGTPNDTADAMYGYGSTAMKRTLTADDLAGIRWVYAPAALPPAPPVIGYSPSSFTFSANEGGTNPGSQVLNINNTGDGSLTWSLSASHPWITLNPASGVSTSTLTPVTVGVNISGLAAGAYNGNITITASGAANTPVTVPVTLTLTPAVSPLGQALDNPGLVWNTSGNAAWFPESSVYYYDGDAAQSGSIGTNQQTTLQTTITGAGTVSFYWKVSSKSASGYLRLYIDGVQKASISGTVNWQQKTYTLGAGTHILEWKYTRDSNTKTSGSNCGWVDKVQFN